MTAQETVTQMFFASFNLTPVLGMVRSEGFHGATFAALG
jgi:hypothetical protein